MKHTGDITGCLWRGWSIQNWARRGCDSGHAGLQHMADRPSRHSFPLLKKQKNDTLIWKFPWRTRAWALQWREGSSQASNPLLLLCWPEPSVGKGCYMSTTWLWTLICSTLSERLFLIAEVNHLYHTLHLWRLATSSLYLNVLSSLWYIEDKKTNIDENDKRYFHLPWFSCCLLPPQPPK